MLFLMLTTEQLHLVQYCTTEYQNSLQSIIILFWKYLFYGPWLNLFWEYINGKLICSVVGKGVTNRPGSEGVNSALFLL
jgi:hypothetical protein